MRSWRIKLDIGKIEIQRDQDAILYLAEETPEVHSIHGFRADRIGV